MNRVQKNTNKIYLKEILMNNSRLTCDHFTKNIFCVSMPDG